MKNEISKNVDDLLKSIKRFYIKRAIEMKCVSCGIEMEKSATYFREGYHIQLCPKCRDIHLIHEKYDKKIKKDVL